LETDAVSSTRHFVLGPRHDNGIGFVLSQALKIYTANFKAAPRMVAQGHVEVEDVTVVKKNPVTVIATPESMDDVLGQKLDGQDFGLYRRGRGVG
jgi:hypothetical protein